jgi:hypothetical protein
MNKKELGQILRKHYGAKSSMVKKVRAGINKPSYEMMVKFDDDGAPLELGWILKSGSPNKHKKQTKKENKNE